MGKINFAECAIEYSSNQTLIDRYGWKGRVVGVVPNVTAQISLQGCKDVCGHGTEYFPWHQIADTITTWVLPSVGVAVQAPFESNRNWNNMLCLARWIGSPIASLTAVLWNITVTARCAMMVDMATSCQHDVDASLENVNFTDIRDSFYILSAMNQFSMMEYVRQDDTKLTAEGLLRVALFSRDLELRNKYPDDTRKHTLRHLRTKTAQYLRAHRKRGVIPVFISTLWFIVAMAISIQSAFGHIGQNAVAHDLALGLLVAWLPLLIFATIVDRNFASTADVRKSLNKLVYETAYALRGSISDKTMSISNESHDSSKPYDRYLDSLRKEFAARSFSGMEGWEEDLKNLSEKCRKLIDTNELEIDGDKGFFRRFAGQGRIRRHYGAAHPILESIEKAYITSQGRNWLLKDEPEARIHLVLKPRGQGLVWFDWRGLWQVFGSITIVSFSVMGAFILSFCVPTIGLGCRSGGYTVFLVVAVFLQIAELVTWAVVIRYHRVQEYLEDESKAKTLKQRAMIDSIFFSGAEIINSAWLINIIVEQTIGGFQTCSCSASVWSSMGGYVDFTQYDVADVEIMRLGWIIGTTLSCAILGLTMVWIFVQWCIQSHLSTEDIDRARSGLKRTRWFLRYLWPFRKLSTGFVWTWQDGPAKPVVIYYSKSNQSRTATPLSDAPILNTIATSASPMLGMPDSWPSQGLPQTGTRRKSNDSRDDVDMPGSTTPSDWDTDPIQWPQSTDRHGFNNYLSPDVFEMSRARTRSRSRTGSRSRSPLLPT